MSYFRRFLIVSVCGVVQIFFASYVLLGLLNLNFFELPSDSFLLPGILIILGSSYLTISYYLGDKKLNNMLYDEYSALRYYKLGAIGYAINGFGVFLIFSMQDWSNWDLVSANRMIYQIAAFAWMVFGFLMLIFSWGDYQEYHAERSS
ncbi:MAG: hypothetical protein CMD61_02475 [Gammaproteobacteria bacterium]|jgi:hypothetical protein|nr:hypothetical protein [Gammaproteobacteria bacterium]|tara:strand:+ start:79 stop:522 length:444 start_codon:yes stop_codon:yes gene_type:complete